MTDVQPLGGLLYGVISEFDSLPNLRRGTLAGYWARPSSRTRPFQQSGSPPHCGLVTTSLRRPLVERRSPLL